MEDKAVGTTIGLALWATAIAVPGEDILLSIAGGLLVGWFGAAPLLWYWMKGRSK